MILNIKNDETHALVRELAALKGFSQTHAVEFAVRNELDRQKAEQEKRDPRTGLAAWLMKISEETAPLMNDGRTLKQLMDELYDDETGLPK